MKQKLRQTYNEYKVRPNLDTYYGLYDSIEEALKIIPRRMRSEGRTVGILESGSVVEYWFESGIEDSDLVVKGGGGSFEGIETEDSDTVTFTGNGTVGNPLSAESVGGGTTGDYIPLSGTEVDKPITGDIEFTDNKKISWESKGLIFNFLFSGAFATLSNNYNSKTLSLSSDLINYEDDNNESISVLFYSTEQDYSSIKIQNNNPTNLFRGLVGNIYYGDNYTDNTCIQKLYADKQHSYSTTEIKTGGTWIDGKPIYTITQFTADTPPTMETVFPTEVIGTYTVYKYTKP